MPLHPTQKNESDRISAPKLTLMEDYLKDRSQLVCVNSKNSKPSLTGPISVTQGSVMSCTLFLIYTMDQPEIHHQELHRPLDYLNCPAPTTTTFVDDATILVKAKPGQNLQKKPRSSIFSNSNLPSVKQTLPKPRQNKNLSFPIHHWQGK